MLINNSTDKLLYIIFLLIGANFSVMPGLNFYDVVIFIYLIYLYITNGIYLSKNTRYFIISLLFLIIIFSIISIFYQVIAYSEFTQYSIYIVYNTSLLIIYILFISNVINKVSSNFNYNILMLFFTLPLVFAELMYFSEYFNELFKSLYSITKQHPFRAAGIWGNDANQLGYYATLTIIFTVFLLHYRKINLVLSIIILILGLTATIQSGMRTGLVVIIPLFMIMALIYKKPILRLRQIVIFITILSLSLYLFLSNYLGEEIIQNISARFDLLQLVDDISGDADNGQVGNMYAKWYHKFSTETSLSDALFSFDYKWKFPDSLVIYYFANNGLIGVFFLIVFIGITIYLIVVNKYNYMAVFIFIFSLVISIKGSFILNNIGMFIFVLLYSLDQKWKKLKGGVFNDIHHR